MNQKPPYNVLFLCTGNSARSILAESLLNQYDPGKFRGFSAGSQPQGAVHPMALELLKQLNFPTQHLRSKSWDEFATAAAPPLDFVFTVCDNAAGEACPYFPGQPMTAHWGIPDPAAVAGSAAARWLAFRTAFRSLDSRIKVFTSLPLASLDRIRLQARLNAIGQTPDAPDEALRMHRAASVTIYHNPLCGTSRNTLALIRNAGLEPTVIEYLQTPPDRATLQDLLARMGMAPRELLREKGTPYGELNLGAPHWTDDDLIDQMLAHPILINRPIVVTPWGVRLCRPSQSVLGILPHAQRGPFAKEDGEQVLDEQGRECTGGPHPDGATG